MIKPIALLSRPFGGHRVTGGRERGGEQGTNLACVVTPWVTDWPAVVDATAITRCKLCAQYYGVMMLSGMG